MIKKGILYKEWLKLRWVLVGALTLVVLANLLVFINIQHRLNFVSAAALWSDILFSNNRYFDLLEFLFVLIGIGMALFQFVPEIIDKRIKLSFHLPMSEDKLLLLMLAYGYACLLAVLVVHSLVFILLSAYFFPVNIIWPAMASVLVWMLAGLYAYNYTVFVMLEPRVIKRVLFSLLGVAGGLLFFESSEMGGTSPMIPFLSLFLVLNIPTVLYSSWRLRKQCIK